MYTNPTGPDADEDRDDDENEKDAVWYYQRSARSTA
jgi:hypothetical protein